MNESLIRKPGFWISLLLHLGVFLFLYQRHYVAPKPDSFRELAEFKFEDKPKEIKPIEQSATKAEHILPNKPLVGPKQQSLSPRKQPDLMAPVSKLADQISEAPPLTVEERQSEEIAKSSVVEKTEPMSDAPKKVVVSTDSESPEIKGAWGKYGHQLAEEANRYKEYPAQAIAARMQGTVVIAIKIKLNAQFETKLSQSSGFEAIDRMALKMVDQALRKVPFPDDLKNKPKELYIPIAFKL